VVFAADKATEMPTWKAEEHNKSRKAAIKKFVDLGLAVVKKLKKGKSAAFWKPYQDQYALIRFEL
jgi:hypothetical protein